MNYGIEPFFDEVPGIVWEMEARGDEWYFTRRYGEYRPENRRDVIGKSLFDILPRGHPVVQTILRGIQSQTYFTFIDGTTPGRLYQNRCKPITDENGNVRRLIGVSIDITESLVSQIDLLDNVDIPTETIQRDFEYLVREIIGQPDFYKHFYLLYQPIIDLKQDYFSQNWVCGVEALIRLKVEERIISPNNFLHLIESKKTSGFLTQWVITKACQQLKEIIERQPNFYLSINTTIEDLLNPNVFDSIANALTINQVPPSNLHLEILEMPNAIVADRDGAILEAIYKLRELGIKITIDDFGKQSSNFDRLGLLAGDDFLKIDRSFVPHQIYGKEASICTAIAWIAKVFQLRLIAEGIENPEQANFMKTIGCDYAQGYFFYRPMTIESLSSIIESFGDRVILDD